MTFSINKMLGGGGMPPFTYYQPVMTQGLSAATSNPFEGGSSKTSDNSSSSLTDKDLLEMLGKIQGVPSDMNLIFKQVERLYSMPSLGGMNSSRLLSLYVKILHGVKQAAFNKLEFEHAYDLAVKNKTLGEYAVTSRGQVVCLDKNNEIKTLDVNTVINSKDYTPLTNNDLLQIRRNNKPMDNSILSVVQLGISMDMINNYIQNITNKLGKSNLNLEGYSETKDNNIVKGILFIKNASQQELLSLMEINGTYKSTLNKSSQTVLAQLALNYIYSTMPTNMKTLLELKGGSKEGGLQLIGQLINSGLTDVFTFNPELELDSDGNKVSKKGNSSGENTSDSTDKTNPVRNILNGIGGDVGKFQINKGGQAELSVDGVNYRSFIDTSGKTIQDTDLSTMLAESGIQSIVDKNSISFGSQILNSDQISKIIYRNNGGTRVILPFIKENGKIKPDYSILDDYQKIIDKVNSECTPSTPIEERRKLEIQYLQEAGLTDLVNSNGEYNLDRMCAFLVTDGYVSTKDVNIDSNNDLVQEVTDDSTIDFVKDTLTKDDKHQYQLDKKEWFNPFDWFGNYDKIYSASVYIPIVSNNELASITGYGNLVKTNIGYEKEANYQRFLKLSNLKLTRSDVL